VTADRRLRIGGWAALATAIIAPLELALIFVESGGTRRPGPSLYLVTDVSRFACLLAAVAGLDALFRRIAPRGANVVVIAGSIGAGLGIVAGVALLAGIDAPVVQTIAVLLASLLAAVWFVGGGGILMHAGGGLARIGWPAQLGGLGLVLAATFVALSISGPGGTSGPSLLNWFQLVGLFVIVYLVRIWFYVVRGRLPGPGVL